MKISQLSTIKSCTYTSDDGDTMDIKYDESKVTPERLDEMASAKNEAVLIVDFVCLVVKAWELFEDNGDPVALEPDRVRQLPLTFLAKVIDTIQENQKPGEAK